MTPGPNDSLRGMRRQFDGGHLHLLFSSKLQIQEVTG
jgi:hypothetical protein